MLTHETHGNDPGAPLAVPLTLANKNTISVGDDCKNTKPNCHTLRLYHYMRRMVENDRVILCQVPEEIQLADLITRRTSKLRSYIYLVSGHGGNNRKTSMPIDQVRIKEECHHTRLIYHTMRDTNHARAVTMRN